MASLNDRPNILLIVTDQQHPDTLGLLDRIPVQTPNLDRLAAGGTTFTRAYTPCPLCTPARASLLTGQYPSRHGAWSIGTDTPEDALSLPALLAARGYRTALLGKSHLRSCQREDSFEALPQNRDWEFFRDWNGPWYGFETARINVGHTCEPHSASMHYGLWLRDKGIELKPPYFAEPGDTIAANAWLGHWDLPAELHPGAWLAEETGNYLRDHAAQHADRPFFASVNFADPHQPFVVPEPWDEMYADARLHPPKRRLDEAEGKPTVYRASLDGTLHQRGWQGNPEVNLPSQYARQTDTLERSPEEDRIWRTYLGMISLLDKQVGQILDTLEETGQAENTVVVFTSDHGDYMGDHWLWSKGGSHYDGGIRVPMIVRQPGRVPAGQRSTALQSLVDFAPTFLDLAGCEPHSQMQGRSQAATWADSEQPTRDAVLIDHRVEEGLYVNTLVTDRHRFSHHSFPAEGREECECYDLAGDPDEFDNLANDPANNPLLNQLQSRLLRERMAIQGPWSPRPTFA